MWYLTDNSGKITYIHPNDPLKIGRKKGHILLPQDASVSKLHVVIEVHTKKNISQDKQISMCIIKDQDSKYGTYVLRNGQYEKLNEMYILKNNDVIRIGLQQAIYTVTYVPVITFVSSIQEDKKAKLNDIMDDLDGLILPRWESFCTHLTVGNPNLTIKVSTALAAGMPIVTIDYWEAVKSSMEKGESLPKIDNFIPEIQEHLISKTVVSLSPNTKRRTLFRDKTFVHFITAQYENYKNMISLAGGKSILFSKESLSIAALCEPNIIVVQHFVSDETQCTENSAKEYSAVCEMLQQNKIRIIAETEISLAILYCSTERYCNPKYNYGGFFQKKTENIIPETLVMDTQDEDSPKCRLLPKVVSNIKLAKKINVKSQQMNCYIPETVDTYVIQSQKKKSWNKEIEKIENIQKSHERNIFIAETVDFSEDKISANSKHNEDSVPKTSKLTRTKGSPDDINDDIKTRKGNSSTQKNLSSQQNLNTSKPPLSAKEMFHKSKYYIPETLDLLNDTNVTSKRNDENSSKSTTSKILFDNNSEHINIDMNRMFEAETQYINTNERAKQLSIEKRTFHASGYYIPETVETFAHNISSKENNENPNLSDEDLVEVEGSDEDGDTSYSSRNTTSLKELALTLSQKLNNTRATKLEVTQKTKNKIQEAQIEDEVQNNWITPNSKSMLEELKKDSNTKNKENEVQVFSKEKKIGTKHSTIENFAKCINTSSFGTSVERKRKRSKEQVDIDLEDVDWVITSKDRNLTKETRGDNWNEKYCTDENEVSSTSNKIINRGQSASNFSKLDIQFTHKAVNMEVKNSTSSLRKPLGKTFKKIPVAIPQRRITFT